MTVTLTYELREATELIVRSNDVAIAALRDGDKVTVQLTIEDQEDRRERRRLTRRYREVTPPSHVVQTFEWDGMPGRVRRDDDARRPGGMGAPSS